MAEICFLTFRSTFTVAKGIKLALDELKKSQVVRSFHVGLPIYVVNMNGKLIGPENQPWSVGVSNLAETQLCKTVGKVLINPSTPDVIILEINLFAAPANIPVALQILQQRNIPVELVSEPADTTKSDLVPVRDLVNGSEVPLVDSSSSTADLSSKDFSKDRTEMSKNSNELLGKNAGILDVAYPPVNTSSDSTCTSSFVRESSIEAGATLSVSDSSIQKNTSSNTVSMLNLSIAKSSSSSNNTDNICSGSSLIPLVTNEITNARPVTQPCNNVNVGAPSVNISVELYSDCSTKIVVPDISPLQATIESPTTSNIMYSRCDSKQSVCTDDNFLLAAQPKLEEFSVQRSQNFEFTGRKDFSPSLVTEQVTKVISDDSLNHTPTHNSDVAGNKSHISIDAEKINNPKTDQGFVESCQHHGKGNTVIKLEPFECYNKPTTPTKQVRDRFSTDSGIILDDSSKHDDSAVILIDSSDESKTGDEDSDITILQVVDNSNCKPNEMSEIDSSKTLVITQSTYSVCILGEEVRVIVKEDLEGERAVTETCSVNTVKASLSLASNKEFLTTKDAVVSDSHNTSTARITESEMKFCQTLELFKHVKTENNSEQDVKLKVKTLQLDAADCQPGPSGFVSTDETKADVKPFKELAVDCKPVTSGETSDEGVRPCVDSDRINAPIGSSMVDIKPNIALLCGQVCNRDLTMPQCASGVANSSGTTNTRDDGSDGEKTNSSDIEPLPPMKIDEVDKLFEDSLPEFDKSTMMEPTQVITTPLLPHQKQALKWMVDRENGSGLAPFWQRKEKGTWFNQGTREMAVERPNSVRGGILADDMGLGKTLVVISLILTNHINGKPMFSKKRAHNSQLRENGGTEATPSTDQPEVKKPCLNDDRYDGTKKTPGKRNEICRYRAKRIADNKSLKQPGFAFRQFMLPKLTENNEKKIKKEKKKIKSESSAVCGADKSEVKDAVSSQDVIDHDMEDPVFQSSTSSCFGSLEKNQSGTATLILCPVSVISNWIDQLTTHVHHKVKLQVYMYHGPDRTRDVNFLSQQDIVITTYNTLSNDYNLKGNSPLHKIFWLRIILDEGHIIRNERTNQTKSTLLLKSKRRWALTGTPIQNRTEDLYSLLCFLRMSPFDNRQWWNMTLGGAVKRGDPRALTRLQRLVRHVSLRRLKTDQVNGRPIIRLPERKVIVQDIELSLEEREVYDLMQKRGQLIIKRYFDQGTVLKHYAHCFAILMKLRQLCLHINLCSKKELNRLHSLQSFRSGGDIDSDDEELEHEQSVWRLIKELLHLLSSGVDEECSICLDSLVDPVITRCAHAFCLHCIRDVINSDSLESTCPLCRAPVNENELIKVPEQRREEANDKDKGKSPGQEWKSSTKVDHLMATLEALREKDETVKSLVVSQFTSFLDIIEIPLEKNGFQFVRLDGTMPQELRAEAIETFSNTSPTAPTILLLSLSAGGVGLNLTAASHIFLMDPAWNPAVEEQCFDRCHRLGQTRDVLVTKYIVTDSVEERMLKLQATKRELMNQAFGVKRQTQEERRKARIDDIRNLIGL